MLYRAYLLKNEHVCAAIDLTGVDDDDAKQQAANLSNARDIELWQGDRRASLFRTRKRALTTTY
jgi:hypothetical protein